MKIATHNPDTHNSRGGLSLCREVGENREGECAAAVAVSDITTEIPRGNASVVFSSRNKVPQCRTREPQPRRPSHSYFPSEPVLLRDGLAALVVRGDDLDDAVLAVGIHL